MNLAAILGIYLLSMGLLSMGHWAQGPSARGVPEFAAQQAAAPASPTQQSQPTDSAAPPASTSPPQGTQPTQPSSAAGQAPDSASQAKPSAQRPRHHNKKKSVPCSDSPAAGNPSPSNSGDSANPTGAGSANTGSSKSSATLPPCPPPKKVVRNGGSEEPSIQLVGGAPSDHASQKRSTEQLAAATEENLKKIAGRQLNPTQQEMVNQVKQFMDQSKTAVAAGDMERGHNLVQKARLLSEELVKP
jgi:hypothetical protein